MWTCRVFLWFMIHYECNHTICKALFILTETSWEPSPQWLLLHSCGYTHIKLGCWNSGLLPCLRSLISIAVCHTHQHPHLAACQQHNPTKTNSPWSNTLQHDVVSYYHSTVPTGFRWLCLYWPCTSDFIIPVSSVIALPERQPEPLSVCVAYSKWLIVTGTGTLCDCMCYTVK